MVQKSFILAILLFLIASCTTPVAVTMDEVVYPEAYFKKAQEAVNLNRYADAIEIYNLFILRHPNDYERCIIAQFSIAQIQFTRGKYGLAREEFEKVLSLYETPLKHLYPERYRIMAEKKRDESASLETKRWFLFIPYRVKAKEA